MRITARLVISSLTVWLVSQQPLAAQPADSSPTAGEPTVLELTEEARREVAQDELVASLVAHAEAAEPAAAQDTVNRMMAMALEAARKVAGVRETSGSYLVSQQTRAEGEPPVWVAEQQLNLTSSDGPALLGLVGELQGAGLAIQELRWTLSANARRGIERQLLAEALDALTRTARTAADGLGMRHMGWRRVSLRPSGPVEPYPRMMMASRAAAAEAAPPVTAAGTSEVVVAVAAEALLVPAR